MIAKTLFCGAVLVGTALGSAAQAGADPSVFGQLSCSCHEVAPADSPVLTDMVEQGIRQGLSGLPSSPPMQ